MADFAASFIFTERNQLLLFMKCFRKLSMMKPRVQQKGPRTDQHSIGFFKVSGPLSSTRTDENVQKIRHITHEDRRPRINPLKPELIPICYLLALLGAHHFLHVSRIRVKSLTFRLLMSYIYIYGALILDVSRSHTTTQHSR